MTRRFNVAVLALSLVCAFYPARPRLLTFTFDVMADHIERIRADNALEHLTLEII